MRLAVNFGKASVKHVATGRQKRTPERIAEIVEICRANTCGLYNARHGWCEHRSCGCKVKRKAGWQREKCPVGLWE